MRQGQKSVADWERFEEAVSRFVAALDPTASVSRNVKIPDRDTGVLRQRDVWIEAKVCGLFIVRVLISCKAWKRKINSAHLDAFLGELASSGADKGVIYSKRGFTQPAIAKAREQGVACCILYEDEPAELPESLSFTTYCCLPKIRLKLGPREAIAAGSTWGDVFAVAVNGEGAVRSLLDELVSQFEAQERSASLDLDEDGLPKDWNVLVTTTSPWRSGQRLELTAETSWRIFEGDIEAQLVNGTYLASEGVLIGSQSTPWINTAASHPGPAWRELDERPSGARNRIAAVLYGGDIRKTVLDAYSGIRAV